jgi:hypothetical protein
MKRLLVVMMCSTLFAATLAGQTRPASSETEDSAMPWLVTEEGKFEIGDLTDERIGFAVERPRTKVRAHTAAEVLRLADINHPACRVFMQVDAG